MFRIWQQRSDLREKNVSLLKVLPRNTHMEHTVHMLVADNLCSLDRFAEELTETHTMM